MKQVDALLAPTYTTTFCHHCTRRTWKIHTSGPPHVCHILPNSTAHFTSTASCLAAFTTQRVPFARPPTKKKSTSTDVSHSVSASFADFTNNPRPHGVVSQSLFQVHNDGTRQHMHSYAHTHNQATWWEAALRWNAARRSACMAGTNTMALPLSPGLLSPPCNIANP